MWVSQVKVQMLKFEIRDIYFSKLEGMEDRMDNGEKNVTVSKKQ